MVRKMVSFISFLSCYTGDVYKRRMKQRSGELNISNMSEETIEENLPDLSPHLEDGFSLKQLETLHDYAVKAFKAGIEYANNNRKGAVN